MVLSIASAIGGAIGAMLLLRTSDETFTKILPLLMLGASAVFTVGPRLSALRKTGRLSLAMGACVQLLIASYGGYFGGGMGILMLATFTLMGMTNLHSMNGLKTVLGVFINGAANVAFFIAHKVVVSVALPVAIGSVVGAGEPPAGSTVTPTVSPALMAPSSTRHVVELASASNVPAEMGPLPPMYQSW